MKRIFLCLLLVLNIVVLRQSAQCATELDPALDSVAHSIFAEVMSPFCAGRLLQDCPSSEATELKEKIRQKLVSGESEQQVLNYLYTLYGEQIRAAPSHSGFGMMAWIIPPIFLLAGLALAFVWIKSRTLQKSEPSASLPLSPEMKARIEAEMAKQ